MTSKVRVVLRSGGDRSDWVCLDSSFILKVDTMECFGCWDRKRRVKNNAEIFGSSKWLNGVLTGEAETVERAGLAGNIKGSVLRCLLVMQEVLRRQVSVGTRS